MGSLVQSVGPLASMNILLFTLAVPTLLCRLVIGAHMTTHACIMLCRMVGLSAAECNGAGGCDFMQNGHSVDITIVE